MDVTRALRRLHLHATYGDHDADALAEEIAELLRRLPVPHRQMVVRHAYWRVPSIPPAVLRDAVGGDEALRALAGRGPVVGSCGGCGRIRRARCRDEDPVIGGDCACCRAGPEPVVRRSRVVAARRRSTAVRFGWRIRPVA